MVKIRLQSISNLQCVRVGFLAIGGKIYGGFNPKFVCGIICHTVGDKD